MMIAELVARGHHVVRRTNQSGEVTELVEIISDAPKGTHIGQAVAPLLFEV
jgi:hypothetical protein